MHPPIEDVFREPEEEIAEKLLCSGETWGCVYDQFGSDIGLVHTITLLFVKDG